MTAHLEDFADGPVVETVRPSSHYQLPARNSLVRKMMFLNDPQMEGDAEGERGPE